MSAPTDDDPRNDRLSDLEGTPWVRLGAILASMGAAFVWVVTHWVEVQPVLESPASVLLAMMTIYGLGGLSIYWIVSRPLEQRLKKTESLVSELRKVERGLLRDDADKASRIAALEVTVKFLTDQLADVRRSVADINSPKTPARRSRKTET